MELKEWTLAYLKSRDSVLRKIKEIADKGNHLEVQTKDGIVKYYLLKDLDSIDAKEPLFIITPNTESNLNILIKSWNKFSSKNRNIIFVNLKNNEKWQINPKLHSMIADPESIEQGLRTMYDTCNGNIVEPTKSKKKAMFEESSNQDEENEEADGN